MEDEKSFMHTLILGVCIIISAILIARMAFYKPVPYFEPHKVPKQTESQESSIQIQFTEQELTAILQNTGLQDSPLRELAISIQEDCQISLSGVLQKDKLQDMLADTASMNLLKTALALMPEECALSAQLSIAMEDGMPCLHVLGAQAGGVDLPQTILQLMEDEINETWKTFLSEQGIGMGEITTGKGVLYVKTQKNAASESFSEAAFLCT